MRQEATSTILESERIAIQCNRAQEGKPPQTNMATGDDSGSWELCYTI